MLSLIALKNIPVSGPNKGAFKNIIVTEGKDDEGNPIKDLVVTVELEAKDPAGKNFQLDKRYSLLDNSRGLSTFRNDYKSWCGKKLLDRDLAAFDPEKLMTNQPVTVVVKHGKDGKEKFAKIDTFLPVAPAAPAAPASPASV